MWTCELPPLSGALPPLSDAIGNWFHIPELVTLKDRLQAVKVSQEGPRHRNPFKWDKTTSQFSLSLALRDTLLSAYNLSHCTNAALKALELFHAFDLFDGDSSESAPSDRSESAPSTQNVPFVYFDNAALPGAFILMAHYYDLMIKERTEAQHQWYANSLVDMSKAKDAAAVLSATVAAGSSSSGHSDGHGDAVVEVIDPLLPLGDTYGLMAAFPDRWLMKLPEVNGDLLCLKTQDAISARLRGKVDLCSSDLGFEAVDPNNQELEHLPAHLGQILSGLVALKPGGHLLVKQFTFFEPVSVSLLAVLRSCFAKVILAKPMASKSDNSEIYLVCKHYQPERYQAKDVEQHLRLRITTMRLSRTPMVPMSCMGSAFVQAIVSAAQQLTDRQSASIKATIEAFEQLSTGRDASLRHTRLWQQIQDQARQWQVDNAFLVEYPTAVQLRHKRASTSNTYGVSIRALAQDTGSGPPRKRKAANSSSSSSSSARSGGASAAPKYTGPMECGIKGFLNTVRRHLLTAHIKQSNIVLDVGIGAEASDLETYRDIRTKHILAVDKSYDVIETLTERLQRWVNMGQRTTTFCADMIKSQDIVQLIRQTGASVIAGASAAAHPHPMVADAVVLQFALPAAVASEQDCVELLRRLHGLLRRDRRVMGIHLDVDRVMQLGQAGDGTSSTSASAMRSVRLQTPLMMAICTQASAPASASAKLLGRVDLQFNRGDGLDNIADNYAMVTRDLLVKSAVQVGFEVETYMSTKDYAAQQQLNYPLTNTEQEWASMFVLFVLVKRS